MAKNLIPTIGIECHVQLRTKTKLFSGADNDARDKEPNTTVSPICFALPGTLPVLNKEAIRLALRAGAALNAELPTVSRFERKHYFYPDLPKGYQTTQLAEPVIGKGLVVTLTPDGVSHEVRIHHAHLEEDAGKLTHPAGANYSLVDLNRAGTPLIEIVSEPDIHSAEEARAFAEELYTLMTWAEVTEGDLYHGNMRFDVNVSVAEEGDVLGTRTETKNLNSFRAVEKAAEYEIKRQSELLASGEKVIQETRGWDDVKLITFSQRSKENAHDYRYFPDADIPPVKVSDEQKAEARESLPKMPSYYRDLWAGWGLEAALVKHLLSNRSVAEKVTHIGEAAGEAVAIRVAHWATSVLDQPSAITAIDHDELISLSEMVADNTISSSNAKIVLEELLGGKTNARQIAKDNQLVQINDESFIEEIVQDILNDPASQKAVGDIRSGNEKAIGYLVGQAMKRSKGQANPARLTQIFTQKIKEG